VVRFSTKDSSPATAFAFELFEIIGVFSMAGFEHSPPDAPWRRQDADTEASWKAFKHYVLCGPSRTLERTATAVGHKNSRTVKDWSRKKDWVKRCEEYDIWLMERGERDKKQAQEIEEYARALQQVYEDTMKASQVLLKLTIQELVKLQKRSAEDGSSTDIKLNDLTKAMATSLRAIDTASSARGTLLGVDAIQEMFKAQ
jgi:hypothetical protein